jgi:hypothetical protein
MLIRLAFTNNLIIDFLLSLQRLRNSRKTMPLIGNILIFWNLEFQKRVLFVTFILKFIFSEKKGNNQLKIISKSISANISIIGGMFHKWGIIPNNNIKQKIEEVKKERINCLETNNSFLLNVTKRILSSLTRKIKYLLAINIGKTNV